MIRNKDSKNKVSCIIPFWNEGERLYKVLDEVIKVKNIFEVICIDDASDKNKSNNIRKRYSKIEYIRLKQNVGKSNAIFEGLKYTQGSLILLLDADLRNLNHSEIEEAIKIIQQNPDIDMLILRRIKAPLFVKLTRGDVLATGERIIKKNYLLTILNNSTKGWELESKINLFMLKNKKNVLCFPHSGINTHWKWGLSTDLKYHRKKMTDIFSIGLINLIKLFLFFGKKEFSNSPPA